MGGDYEDKIEAPERRAAKPGVDDPVDEVTVGSIRFHQSRGQVHFHDDKAGLKCYVPKSDWWGGWNRIRSPSNAAPHQYGYIDLENETELIVSTRLEKDVVKVAMSVKKHAMPGSYDKAWHALEQFTNLSAKG